MTVRMVIEYQVQLLSAFLKAVHSRIGRGYISLYVSLIGLAGIAHLQDMRTKEYQTVCFADRDLVRVWRFDGDPKKT